jgi:uncharacterized phage protein (TIGR01671 family)
MRTIKFRGKGCNTNKCVYGSLLIAYDPFDKPYYTIAVKGSIFVRVIPDTVGQFTGLLDSNGKEIYEGDILQLRDKNKTDGYLEGAVAYDETLCYFVWKFMGTGIRPLAEWVLDREYIITVKEEEQ